MQRIMGIALNILYTCLMFTGYGSFHACNLISLDDTPIDSCCEISKHAHQEDNSEMFSFKWCNETSHENNNPCCKERIKPQTDHDYVNLDFFNFDVFNVGYLPINWNIQPIETSLTIEEVSFQPRGNIPLYLCLQRLIVYS